MGPMNGQLNLVTIGLIAQLILAAVAVVLAVVVPARARSVVAGTACAALGTAGAVTGVAALTAGASTLVTGTVTGLVIPLALPTNDILVPPTLAPTPLGGLFLLVAGAVGALAAIYGIGYAHGPSASRTGWAAFALFLLGMQLVPAAGDVLTFLLAWEVMALASTVLLLSDHAERPEVRPAALWYAVMTHLSFLALLAGFALLATHAGTTRLAGLAGNPPDGPTASIAFVLLVAGFATKAGLVPVHVWLPRAHPEAPSHVSAAMSAAMVKMGVYGILVTILELTPRGPRWWAVLLLALGAVSALYGILQASVNSDLKRLLAYSTTENVGLAVTAIAVGMLLRDAGQVAVADVATLAGLLLVVSHAAFKTVLFFGAGSILKATGHRDLDRLGGLVHTHPITTWTFGVAALGASAIPMTSGFVAEWVLLQALVHGNGRADRVIAVALPVTVALVALTVGLGLLTFVKAFGTAFLARPRSPHAARPTRGVGSGARSWSMALAMLVGAAIVLGLGLAVGPVAQVLARSIGARGVLREGLTGLSLPAVDAVLDPLSLTLLALAVALPVGLLLLVVRGRIPRRDVELPWGCGGVRTSPRMEYTATSYAEPLVRVFGEALRPKRSLEVAHFTQDTVLESRVAFAQQVVDVVEVRAYGPAEVAVRRLGDAARRIQNGSIHRYLAFSFVALLVVLVAVTL